MNTKEFTQLPEELQKPLGDYYYRLEKLIGVEMRLAGLETDCGDASLGVQMFIQFKCKKDRKRFLKLAQFDSYPSGKKWHLTPKGRLCAGILGFESNYGVIIPTQDLFAVHYILKNYNILRLGDQSLYDAYWGHAVCECYPRLERILKKEIQDGNHENEYVSRLRNYLSLKLVSLVA